MSVPGGASARAAAVVIGAGAFGAATAYHLARRGLDVALLDQHALGSQTSPRAAGLTSQADPFPVLARLRREACDAFARFEEEMGCSVGYHRSGSLRAAYTEAGEARVREGLATAQALGIPAGLISPAEAERLAPHFMAGAPRAILHVPDDGWLDPARLAIAFAARATELGARALPFTRVTGIIAEGGRVAGITTDRGEIRAPVVVDAAGAWTARVAAGAGLRVPLVPVRHQLLVTEPIPGVAPLQPIVRMVEASVYVRHEQGGLLFGGYEDAPRVVDAAALPPAFQIADLPLDLAVLRALIDEVGEHFPALRTARVAIHRGGLPTMTADGRPLLGRVPGLDGFFVASGCCVGGLGLSPAAGRALADLIVDGKSEPDLGPLSVERFRGRHEDPAALEAACVAQYARRYVR
jgi:glycine/D-amino acid oxidase-like deaminating enzyme